MMKRMAAVLAAMVMTFSLAACGGGGGEQTTPSGTNTAGQTTGQPTSEQPTAGQPTASETAPDTAERPTVKYGVLNGPTGLGVTGLHMSNAAGITKNNYELVFAGAPDEMVAKVTSGEVDIAAVPTNIASTLYNNTGGNVQQLANITLGVLYILEDGDSIQTLDDLKGKTLYATGQGSSPEYVINYILAQNGLSDDVKIEYKTEHSELATLLAAGDVDIALLPEPFVTSVTMQNPDISVALNVNELWEEASSAAGNQGSKLVMSSVIAKKDFIEGNPEAVANFLADYAASVEYVNANPKEAAEYIEQQGLLGMKAAVAEKAIPNSSMVFITGADMKGMTSNFLQVLLDANPKAVGGTLPADDFYHE